jgi:hypothetical protein
MFYMPNWPLPHVEYAQGAIVFVVKLCDQMYKPFLFDKERGGCCLSLISVETHSLGQLGDLQ